MGLVICKTCDFVVNSHLLMIIIVIMGCLFSGSLELELTTFHLRVEL